MPWTVDNPPSVARNWSRERRAKCVAAANAVLRDGGKDEDAIYACIHAAGKGGDVDMEVMGTRKAEEQAGMEYKSSPAEFKTLGDQGQYEGHFAITGNVDDGQDRILPGAFKKTIKDNAKRVRVFYAHDWMKLIGPPPDSLTEDEHGLNASGHLTLTSFWGNEAWQLMKDKALTEGSIGFMPVKFEFVDEAGMQVRNLKEIKLFEISPVPLGMNASTAVRAVKAALVMSFKAAIPPHTTAKADPGEAWDAAAVMKACDGAKQLRLVCAWVDPEGDPASKGSYKLPHHLPDGRVVLRGVQAAGGAIAGSRGGVSIPTGDIAGVKRHLETHYHQFDKQAPWENQAGLEVALETICAIMDEIKAGAGFVTAEPQRALALLHELDAFVNEAIPVVKAAEPPPAEHSALTLRARQVEAALRLATTHSD